MTITIKKRSQPGWLVWMMVFFPFMLGALNGLLGLPGAVRYIMDVAWVFLLIYLYRATKLRWTDGSGKLVIWIVLFLMYTFVLYLGQFQSPLYYLWGLRNEFRFYFMFFSCVVFLNQSEARDYLRIWDILFWVNFAAALFQFFVLGVKQDFLGGIFGVGEGVNGYINIFMLTIVTKALALYLNRQENTRSCFLKCGAALIIAAMAELKFFFAEFLLVVLLALLFSNFTWRKLWILLGALASVILGVALLTEIFPGFSDFFSIQWFAENAFSDKGYTGYGDLNRLNAIPKINEVWLKNGWQRLLGLGLGNCDTSAFAFLNTPFFRRNGDMHYTWLSYAKIYLETGWIGLIFYFGFFVLVYHRVGKIQKTVHGEAACYCLLAKIMAIMCVIISVYNSSLRTEAGYMVYFVLAIPFIYGKCGKWEITREW